jgi:hypothetical protein
MQKQEDSFAEETSGIAYCQLNSFENQIVSSCPNDPTDKYYS